MLRRQLNRKLWRLVGSEDKSIEMNIIRLGWRLGIIFGNGKWRDTDKNTISQPWNYYYSLTISISLMFCSWAINRHSFVHENIQKRQSTVRRSDILSLIRLSFARTLGKAPACMPRFASLLAINPKNFPFFSPPCRTTMWINEHRRCF